MLERADFAPKRSLPEELKDNSVAVEGARIDFGRLLEELRDYPQIFAMAIDMMTEEELEAYVKSLTDLQGQDQPH